MFWDHASLTPNQDIFEDQKCLKMFWWCSHVGLTPYWDTLPLVPLNLSPVYTISFFSLWVILTHIHSLTVCINKPVSNNSSLAPSPARQVHTSTYLFRSSFISSWYPLLSGALTESHLRHPAWVTLQYKFDSLPMGRGEHSGTDKNTNSKNNKNRIKSNSELACKKQETNLSVVINLIDGGF